MTIIYAFQHGAVVRKHHDRIVISVGDETLVDQPINGISGAVLLSGVQVTTQALLHLLDHGVDVSFLSDRGSFRGTVVSARSKNVFLRISQVDLHRDLSRSLDFAKAVILAKIRNGVAMLRRYSYSDRSDFTLDTRVFLEWELRLQQVSASDELLGVEGFGSKLYFENFSRLFTKVSFPGRKYFPAPDPVNASLSLGYSSVGREIQSLLEATGFDPFIGFHHKPSYGRASLSLDLLEEFRHCVVDRLILRLFNKGMLSSDDFEMVENNCLLKKPNLRRFFQAYEDFMESDIFSQTSSSLSPRQAIRKQIEKLKNALESQTPYQPFLDETK